MFQIHTIIFKNTTWYNPPYPSMSNVQTKVNKTFIKVAKEKIPPEHKLLKIFNINIAKTKLQLYADCENNH